MTWGKNNNIPLKKRECDAFIKVIWKLTSAFSFTLQEKFSSKEFAEKVSLRIHTHT